MGLGKKLSAMLVGGMISLAAPASAAVVTIDFSGNGGLQAGPSMNFVSGSVTVTATAGAFAKNGEYNINSRIGQYDGGLGNTTNYQYDYVTNPITCGFLPFLCDYATASVTDGTHEVDDHNDTLTHGVREYIQLDFNGLDVTLLGVEYSHHGLGDDSVVAIALNEEDIIYEGGESSVEADDFADHLSSVFWFGAYGPLLDNNDWKLKSISFFYEDGPTPGQVPAPAGMALLGLGLAGLGLLRRKAA